MDNINTHKTINNIYFDELSDKVDSWLITYLNFDNVDLTIKKTENNLVLLITYIGRGSHRYKSGMHVSTVENYSYFISLIDTTPRDINESTYENISISIRKSKLLNRRKIVIRDKSNHKTLIIHAKKVILDNVTTDNIQPKFKTNVQEPTQEQKRDYNNLPYIIIEIATVALIAFIMHKFLHGYSTPIQTLFMYGIVGFLVAERLDNKIEKILMLLVAVALLAQTPYFIFFIGSFFIYWKFLRNKNN